ncbi:MAG: hypothetical protein QOE77_3635 [Blastocatellia bacterium]|jgi:hypothetical protein|nr:hypothetical protein [Blastocatellia bacterium]
MTMIMTGTNRWSLRHVRQTTFSDLYVMGPTANRCVQRIEVAAL